ncbi:MAG: TonB-dependent receptor [Winogradskyella sp.]|uniref:carboxypeptidase-like regulatory domain-containing protein n=1 Tax=Winogradskyella sp. TaxID=1883156 RepID=UPI0018222019|nr:carboxypeptidase-like regulatory domain-containing protein [Winogradskyella sp.]MBT8244370.1 carboxypeptidase-like regulatory domain-containing protein [Winogradskyella sp.]NNK22503.1 TonB-dependent receptor [Winogradskyella sp.]
MFAQFSLSGYISSYENKPINDANILVYKNQNLIKYTFSKEGRYKIENLETGTYTIEISSLQYEKKMLEFYIDDNKIINFNLKASITKIDEVVIDIERDIKVKGDTIIFKVDAFNKKKGVVVEQMLKSIPGISINSDGVISFQGKLVTNVKIDNDDLFDGGYTILTKNLNADYVEDVEVLQNYTKNPLLKNIRDTEDVAINLTLKEDKKKLLFGNIDVGFATDNRFDVNGNLISFIDKTKSYAFLDINNIGDDVVSTINSILNSKNKDLSYSIGKGETAFKQQSLNTRRPIFDNRFVNFNNSKFTNANTILNLSKNVKVKVNGILFNDTKDFISQNITNFIVENPFQLSENFNTSLNEKLGLAKIDFTWDLSSKERLEYTGSIFRLKSKGQSALQQNGIDISENLVSKSNYQSHFLHYTHKIKDSLAVIVSARHIKEKKPGNYFVSPYLYGDLFEFDNASQLINSNSFLDSEMNLDVVQLGLINNNKHSNLESYLGYTKRNDKVESKLTFEDENDVNFESDEDFINAINLNNDLIYFNNRYRKSFGEINIAGNIDFNYKNINNRRLASSEKNKFFYINAKLIAEFKEDKSNFNLGLASSAKTTNINNALNAFTQIFYRGFYKGLDSQELLRANTIFLNYKYGAWSDNFSFNVGFNYTKNENFLSTDSSINLNFNLTEQIILEDSDSFQVSLGLDRYINFLDSNLKLKSSFNKYNFTDIINTQFREVTSSNLIYGFEMRSAFSGFFNYTLGTEWNGSFFEINSTDFENTNNKSFLDLDFVFSDKFDISVINNFYKFGNLPKRKSTYLFTNILGRYNFRETGFSAFIRVNNLFNNRSFNIFSISETINSISLTPLIERYFMMGLNYKF